MIIPLYILKKCATYTILILITCVFLFATFSTIQELAVLGKGNFNTWALLVYIGALTPSFAYLLMPLAVLLGVMLAFMNLVSYSEYAVLRTSGISLKYLIYLLLIFGVIAGAFNFLDGELVAPKLNHFAKVYQLSKTKQIVSTQLNSGVWSKDGDNKFVNIKQVMPDDTIIDVNIYSYNDNFSIAQYINAKSGVFNPALNQWELHDVNIKDYTGQSIKMLHLDKYMWQTSIIPTYFDALVVAPEDMSVFTLIKYIHHQMQNNQTSQRYQIALWNKLLYPITCITMAILALVFIPTNKRGANIPSKLFFGILIGIAFFFATKLLGFLALLYNWNAILSATSPTIILFISCWYFISKKRD
jgi:lipopolysaccharide export system permease protein